MSDRRNNKFISRRENAWRRNQIQLPLNIQHAWAQFRTQYLSR